MLGYGLLFCLLVFCLASIFKKGTRMNANEIADKLDMGCHDWADDAATMLRQQAEQIESLKQEGKILMQHIADMNEEKNKLRHQKAYIFQLESVLESAVELNKAQAERHKRNEIRSMDGGSKTR
jgi:small-conductance mechanosensitive channel